MFGLKSRRRRRLRRRSAPAAWLRVIERNVPYYDLLPAEDRRELEGLMHVFLAEKHFEACGGTEMTEEIRVTIAAHACVPLLHRDTEFYPLLSSILVYPDAYVTHATRHDPVGLVTEGAEERVGESWAEGSVVLAWEEVLDSALAEDPTNVVIHEFAHQLDDEEGESEGVPILPDTAMYAEWSRVMTCEYDRLVAAVGSGRVTMLDEYGAESPAEFFAVATECFFEQPVDLECEHPELYRLMSAFFLQDPAALVRTAGDRT